MTFVLRRGPPDPDEGRYAVVIVPCWIIAVAAGMLPLRAFSGTRPRPAALRWACAAPVPAASRPTPGRCPECGREPKPNSLEPAGSHGPPGFAGPHD